MSQERRVKEANSVLGRRGAVHALSSMCLSPKGWAANENENVSLLSLTPSFTPSILGKFTPLLSRATRPLLSVPSFLPRKCAVCQLSSFLGESVMNK